MRHDLAVGSVAGAVIVHGFENRFIAAEGIFPCLRSVQLIEGVLDGISVKINLDNTVNDCFAIFRRLMTPVLRNFILRIF